MARYTIENLLQDFYVSDHFGTLCIKGLMFLSNRSKYENNFACRYHDVMKENTTVSGSVGMEKMFQYLSLQKDFFHGFILSIRRESRQNLTPLLKLKILPDYYY